MTARPRGRLLAAAALAGRLTATAARARVAPTPLTRLSRRHARTVSSASPPPPPAPPPQPPSSVGFVGLGAMGGRMAARLLAAGFAVTACDPSPAAREALVERAGALSARLAFASTPAALARTPGGLAAVVTSLPSVSSVQAVYGAMLDPAAGPLTAPLLVDASTAGPATARTLAAAAARARLAPGVAGVVGADAPSTPVTLDAPVSGGVAAAEAGTLTFLCGGPAAGLTAARPVLAAMGTRVIHVGPSPGAGAAAKVANNLALAVQMAGLCEALALGSASAGVDPAALLAAVNASSGRCWASEEYSPVPGTTAGGGGRGGGGAAGRSVPATDGSYTGGFAVRLMRKDLDLAAAEARALLLDDGGGGGGGKGGTGAAGRRKGVPPALASLPMAAAASAVYARLAEEAGDDIDFSGAFKFVYGGGW